MLVRPLSSVIKARPSPPDNKILLLLLTHRVHVHAAAQWHAQHHLPRPDGFAGDEAAALRLADGGDVDLFIFYYGLICYVG